MIGQWWKGLEAVVKFRGYEPQNVTLASFKAWISQFSPSDRALVLRFFDSIIYFSREKVRSALLRKNEQLLELLKTDGVLPEKVIYVQIDDAGSSSPVVLNLIRDRARLEKRGCHLVDSKDVAQISRLTNELGEGAIIYVDDFVGTGDQFEPIRDAIAPNIIGTFSEFLLTAAIGEEGIHKLGKTGVKNVSGFVHTYDQRPLHPLGSQFADEEKTRLRQLCEETEASCYYKGLGYKRAAAMVVLYSNAPDSLPRIFRGSVNQSPRVGILPRFNDLPVQHHR